MTVTPPENREPAPEQQQVQTTPEILVRTREQVTEMLLKVIGPPDPKH
jgi:hypothetical protein